MVIAHNTYQVNEHGLTDDRDLAKYGHGVVDREPYTGPVAQVSKQ